MTAALAHLAAVLGGVEAPAWTPANIASATLLAWYDAENVTLVDTDKVSQMADLSGNGNHATQGNAADRPTWGQDGSSRGLLSFAAGTPPDHIQVPALFAGSANRSVFLFCEAPADCRIFCLGPFTNQQKWHLVKVAAGFLRIEIQGAGYTSELAVSGEQFIGVILDGTTLADHTLYVDSASEQAAGSTTVNTTSGGENAIGNGSGTTLNPITTFREAVVCSGVLSPEEITLLRDYMTGRWA